MMLTLCTPHGKFDYQLRRRRHQRLKLSISHTGITVSASLSTSQAEIEAFIQQHSQWLSDKQQLYQQQRPAPINEWRINQHIQYLGKAILLQTHFTNAPPLFLGDSTLPQHGDILLIDTISYADIPNAIEQQCHYWLKNQAEQWFKTRLEWFAHHTGRQSHRLRLSKAIRSWGQCNSHGVIGLNWRLIHLEHKLIDYVIAHELAHLKYMNHSADFWREVQEIMPDYAAYKIAIKQYSPIFLQ